MLVNAVRLDRCMPLMSGVILYGLLSLVIWLYWPGLNGTFMLDDVPNLEGLKNIKDPHNISHLGYYLLSGPSGPLGRPLSFASFLLNDISWPSHPRSFKYTNLLLHALTGLLIYWLTHRLMPQLGRSRGETATIATFTAALWLLHPIQVSTVLYVVQRMTELSTLFTVAGLAAYTHGRFTVRTRVVRGYVWMSLGIAVGGTLAVLSKESGVLIVFYALVVEYALLRPKGISQPQGWRKWAAVFLFLPVSLLIGWIMIKFRGFESGYAFRDFTMAERLLTQSRILVDYLSKIVLPHGEGSGLFNDDYQISHGLLDPATTLGSIILLAALLILAVAVRRKAPVLTFGILWFFTGHLLESTFIPLELYFEHRNYLPIYGPLMAIAYYTVSAASRIRRVAVPALATLAVLMAVMTWQLAREWGNPLLLAQVWIEEHPTSPRAHQFAADLWVRMGHHQKGRELIQNLTQVQPRHSSAWAQLVTLHCTSGQDFEGYDFDPIILGLQNGGLDRAATPSIQALIKHRINGGCPSLSYERILELLETLIHNESFRKHRRELARLYHLKAEIYMVQGDLDNTVADIQKAYSLDPKVEFALNEAYVLASHGQYNRALMAVEKARSSDRKTPFKVSAHESTIVNLEKRLKAEIFRTEISVEQSQ